MATHSRILAQDSQCIEEPGGLQSMGSQRVRDGEACTHTGVQVTNCSPSSRGAILWGHGPEAGATEEHL